MQGHDEDARFAYLLQRARDEKEAFIAILVDSDNGSLLAEGINRSQRDPTDHSEVAAIRRLAAVRPPSQWPKLTLYTTAEPCPMCAGAIVYSRIDRVVYGIDRESLYARGWHEFRLRAATVFADAQHAGGAAPSIAAYQGPYLSACQGLFQRP